MLCAKTAYAASCATTSTPESGRDASAKTGHARCRYRTEAAIPSTPATYAREHKGSYAHIHITAFVFSVRLCAAAGQERGFSLQRARSGRERLNIISAAHAKLRPVGVSDPTAPRRSVHVGVEASLDCASAHAPGVPESSGVIARTATVEHPPVATSSPARLAGARMPGDYAKTPSGRSCAEQRKRGRRWPRCT